MTEAGCPKRRYVRVEATFEDRDPTIKAGPSGWKNLFLASLAETSNVAASALAAQVTASVAYRLRRSDPSFARDWRAALAEGYEHLELETLHRLRVGTGKDDPKFDTANALRILALHKGDVTRERLGQDEHDEEAILASIDAKLDRMRAREENVTRMLSDNGVSAPRLSGGDD